VWVYEVFIRWHGQDIHFWSVGDRFLLTDPKPVEEVYPEQGGERPYTFGVVNLESHRLFPDGAGRKLAAGPDRDQRLRQPDPRHRQAQSVAPVTKVVKGSGVDLTA
jgi:hypothetical protein